MRLCLSSSQVSAVQFDDVLASYRQHSRMWCPTLNKFAEGITLCSAAVSMEPFNVCAYSSMHVAGHIAWKETLGSYLCLFMPDMHLSHFDWTDACRYRYAECCC